MSKKAGATPIDLPAAPTEEPEEVSLTASLPKTEKDWEALGAELAESVEPDRLEEQEEMIVKADGFHAVRFRQPLGKAWHYLDEATGNWLIMDSELAGLALSHITILREQVELSTTLLNGQGYFLNAEGNWIRQHTSCPKCASMEQTLRDIAELDINDFDTRRGWGQVLQMKARKVLTESEE